MGKKYIDADRLKQTIADNVYPVQAVTEREKMAKDPCEVCREQMILELFARIGGRTLGQKDCENCNVRREQKDG